MRIVIKPKNGIKLSSEIELSTPKSWNDKYETIFSTGYRATQTLAFETCILSKQEQRSLYKTSSTIHLATGGKLDDIKGYAEIHRGICFTRKPQGRIKYIKEDDSFCIAIGVESRLFDQSVHMLSIDKKIILSTFFPIQYYTQEEHITLHHHTNESTWNNDKFDELEIDRAEIIFSLTD